MPRTASAKPSDESKAVSHEKQVLEKRKFRAVINAFVKTEEIYLQDLFYTENSDVLGQNLYAIILQYVNNMRAVDKNYDSFPDTHFNLSNSKTVKKAVEDVAAPKKKPSKKTDTGRDTRSTDEIIREELEAMRDAEIAKRKEETAAEPVNGKPASATKSKQSKKSITTISKTGKLMLAFLAERFVQEVVNMGEIGDDINNPAAFEKYLNMEDKDLNKRFPSRITHTILCAVNTYKHVINDMTSSKLNSAEERIEFILRDKNAFTGDDATDDRSCLIKYVAPLICKYFKVLGYILATLVWVTPRNINSKLIEYAVRVSDSHDQLSLQTGIYKGLFKSYYALEEKLYPTVAKKPAEKPAEKTSEKPTEKKEKKATVRETPVPDAPVKEKKIRPVAKPKAKASKKEEPVPEPEQVEYDEDNISDDDK